MGDGAAGGLCRHQIWSLSWPPSWILSRIRNQVKTARNDTFLCLTRKITHKLVLCIILSTIFKLKEVEKKTCIFTQNSSGLITSGADVIVPEKTEKNHRVGVAPLYVLELRRLN